MRLTSPETLRSTMERGRLSGIQLAHIVGCNQSFINALARGARTSCTPELARRIAEALQVLPAYLFVESPQTTRTHTAIKRNAA